MTKFLIGNLVIIYTGPIYAPLSGQTLNIYTESALFGSRSLSLLKGFFFGVFLLTKCYTREYGSYYACY